MRSKKDGFIRCPKSVIVVKDYQEYPPYTYGCFDYNEIKKLQKCNGLNNICDKNDVDILTTIEEQVHYCNNHYYIEKTGNFCINYDCIPGK